MISGFIKGQELTLTSPIIASGTIDYISANFIFFTNEWKDLDEIWVHFQKGDQIYDAKVVNGKVDKSEHINLDNGEWSVYLHGNQFVNGEVIQRITTERQKLFVKESGVLNGEVFPSVNASTSEKFLAKANYAVDLAEKLRQDLENGEYSYTLTDEDIDEIVNIALRNIEENSSYVSSVTAFPETANEGDVVLLHRCNEISSDDSNSGVLLDIPAIVALGLPEGYEQRVWEITATSPKGRDFYAIIEISRIDDYILTALNLATETIGGRWYWKNGELTTDIIGGEAELPPVYIPLGNVADFTFTKTLFETNYDETPDTDETVIFRTLPVHYMFLKGEWQLVSPSNEALQKLVEELQRNVGKYTPMTRVETTTTGTSIVEPNKMYDYGVVDTLTVVFDEGEANKVNEYLFSFVSGETATVLTLPSSVKWVNELTVESNKRYEISVVDNVALWCAVDYEVTE